MPFEAARLYVSVGADVGEAEAGLRNIGKKVDDFGGQIKGALLQGAAFAVMTAGLQAIGSQLDNVKKAAIEYNDLLEQTRIAFTTMLAPVNDGFKDMQAGAKNALVFMNDLRAFAAKTPFEFPDLVRASQRLMAMGFAAEEVVPQLESIGNVSAAFGKGTEGVNRMTLALGQMSAATVVHKEDLNQLIDVGIPVWDILSAKTGKNAKELQDLVSQGQISSDFFISAFNEWSKNNFGDMMAQQSKTFSGALSNVSEGLNNFIASAAEPFFKAITEGMIQLGDFLTGETWAKWTAVIQAGADGLLGVAAGFAAKFAPIGDMIVAVFGKLNDGDVKGAIAEFATFVSNGIQGALDAVNQFGQGFFGAGWNMVTEFGNGMVKAFDAAIDMVVDQLAELASFLIGNSPPPAGPLKQIDKGGQNTGEAYTGGLQRGFSGVAGVVDETVKTVGGLKQANESIEDMVRSIDSSIDALTAKTKDVKNAIDDIKDAEKDRLESLEDQKRALTERVDYAKEEQSLLMDLEALELQRAEAIAKGSAEERRHIDAMLDGLDAQTKAIQLEDKRAALIEANRKSDAAAALDRLKAFDAEAKEQTKQQSAAERRLAELKGSKQRDTGPTAAEKQLDALKNADRGAKFEGPNAGRIKQLKDALGNTPDFQGPNAAALKALYDQQKAADKLHDAEQDRLRDLKQQNDFKETQLDLDARAAKIVKDKAAGKDVSADEAELARDREKLANAIAEYDAEKKFRAEEAARAEQIAKLEEADRAAKAEWDKQQAAKAAEIKALEDADRSAKDAWDALQEVKQERIRQIEGKVRAEKEAAQAKERKRQDEIADAEKAVAGEKTKDDNAAAERRRQIAGLERQVREENRTGDEEHRRRQEALQKIEQQRIELQQKADALVDKPALARIEAAKAELADRRKVFDLTQKEEEIRRKIALLPIDQQIAAIKRDTLDQLKPLQEQLETYQRQKDALSEQKAEWQNIKSATSDALSDIKEMERAQKAAAKEGGPTFNLKPGEQRVARKPLDPAAAENADKIKQAGVDLAKKLSEGFQEEIAAHFGGIAGVAIGAAIGGILLGPIGALIGGTLGGIIGERLQAKLAEMGIFPDELVAAVGRFADRLKDTLMPAFEAILPLATSLFNFLADNIGVIEGIAVAFAAFAILSTVAGWIAAVMTAFGALNLIIGLVAASLGTAGAGAGLMSILGGIVAILGGPVTIAILAIAAVVGLLTAAWVNNWGDIQGKTAWLAEKIGAAAETIGDWLSYIADGAVGLYNSIVSAWDDISEATTDAWNGIKAFLGEWWDVILPAVIGGPIGLIAGLIYHYWDDIKAATETAWQWIQDKIGELWGAVPEDIRNDLVLIYDNLVERFGAVKQYIDDHLAVIKTAFDLGWTLIKDVVTGVVDAVKKYISDKFDATTTYIRDTVADWAQKLSDAWTGIKTKASELWAAIVKVFDDAFGESARKLGAWLRKFVDDWVTWGLDLKTKAGETGTNLIDGFWQGVDDKRQWLIDGFWGLIRAILGKIKEALGIASPSTVMADIGDSMIQGLMDGVRRLWDGPSGFLMYVLGLVADFEHRILDKLGIPDTGGNSSVFDRIGSAIMKGLSAGITAAWDGATGVLALVAKIPADIIAKFLEVLGLRENAQQAAGRFFDIGKQMIDNLRAGMDAMLSSFFDWVKTNVVEKLPEWIRKYLDIHSPSGVFFDIGQNMMQGLLDGMRSKFADLSNVQKWIQATLGGGSGAADPNAAQGDIANYIRQASLKRGIDPNTALMVALNEGGVEEPAKLGKFNTGWSWWPFQLHYGGSEYPQYGNTAGMGNDFTRATGWQPGDPRAWQASVDFALDHAKRYGWGAWYGAAKVGIHGFDGIDQSRSYDRGGILPEDIYGLGMRSGNPYRLHANEGVFNPDQMAALAPLSGPTGASGGGGSSGDTYLFTGPIYGFDEFTTATKSAQRLNRRRGRDIDVRSGVLR